MHVCPILVLDHSARTLLDGKIWPILLRRISPSLRAWPFIIIMRMKWQNKRNQEQTSLSWIDCHDVFVTSMWTYRSVNKEVFTVPSDDRVTKPVNDIRGLLKLTSQTINYWINNTLNDKRNNCALISRLKETGSVQVGALFKVTPIT